MKRFITTLISSMVIVCIGAVSVLAAGSTEDVVDITSAKDNNGNTAVTTVADTSVALMTSEIASSLTGVSSSELKVVWQKDVTSDVLPATVTYNVNGTDGQTLYSFHWNGSAWELMNSATGPTISTTYTSLSPVAIVARIPAATTPAPASNNAATSPKTGDNAVFYVTMSVVVIACSAAFVVAATTKKN